MPGKSVASSADESLDYSEPVDEQSSYGVDSYVAASSILTASPYPYPDATRTVHEMHLALLYLLSNPEEFQKALTAHPPRGATTLAQWNEEYDAEGSVNTNGDTISTLHTFGTTAAGPNVTPLPFVIFADDAEVVLPQAHTASQLFGVERVEGIELEAAAGVTALSQLFLRWLALMPSGDHLNIIDPPGLTVMRIAGGRYRVTAAHRVVWTWMNEFAQMEEEEETLQMGELVSMTIVDVFETDNNGKLLSYCPTFDNRDIRKTTQAAEAIRKSSTKIMSQWSVISNSQAAMKINEAAKYGFYAAGRVAESVKSTVDERFGTVSTVGSPKREHAFEAALSKAAFSTHNDDDAVTDDRSAGGGEQRSEAYVSDDSTAQYTATPERVPERQGAVI